MAGGKEIPIAANVLGTIGTVLWCIQLIPQIWYNWRRKKTDGLPGSMMLLWGLCASPFGIYMVLQEVNLAIQIQPQIFGTLSLICWAQILIYHHKYTTTRAIILAVVIAMLLGGSEALFILTLRIPYKKGVTWPALLFGIMATILLVLDWVFLTMDALGALFSLLALVAEGSIDILGCVLYCVVLFLEIGICGSHIVWRLLHRGLLKEAKAANLTVDEVLEAKGVSTPSSIPDPESRFELFRSKAQKS
ncbi:hypothetical protein LOZ61_001564 [Ophidiomyces ophidiicola]|nr:hypothetical protein LOZ61_001564 [Ophidiomyces ophidiicola]KAI1925436.1 hypothetical protein LOZ60_004165 [Ophidiomyces ophidiicola]KAI1964426.1 hypothetical protein LOZ59_001460 [Ophidiomyces ophidiicola]KAI2030805.1 hypothetical protein LOZ48_003082 [Ophidiomyces ophidiicola]KAI2099251.1 hypothetical protein LOZ33_002601 [Ophidiomyces ophidiicola]